MSRVTYGRQDEIRQSDSYDDSLVPFVGFEAGHTNIGQNLDALRSVIRMLSGLGSYDTPIGDVRTIKELHEALGQPPFSPCGIVVDAVLQTTGPGADRAPLLRTYEDGTVRTYTYQPNGLTVDTVTVTPLGGSPATYQVDYTPEGIPYRARPV